MRLAIILIEIIHPPASNGLNPQCLRCAQAQSITIHVVRYMIRSGYYLSLCK